MAGIQYDASVSERDEDSFLKYYDPHQKIKPTKNHRSCQLKGVRVPEGRLKIIEGIMPVKEVLRLAKSYGTTLTVLLTAMMLIAFDQEIPLRKRKTRWCWMCRSTCVTIFSRRPSPQLLRRY